MPNRKLDPGLSLSKVIYFEKDVIGPLSKSFDSFVFAYDFATQLSKDPKYHRVHIVRTEFFYLGGSDNNEVT